MADAAVSAYRTIPQRRGLDCDLHTDVYEVLAMRARPCGCGEGQLPARYTLIKRTVLPLA
jgi:hypothetical protein